MLVNLIEKLYLLGSKVVPMDFTRVLILDFAQHRSNSNGDIGNDNSTSISLANTSMLKPWVTNRAYELSHNIIDTIDNEQVYCVAAFVNDDLAGYVFFCVSPVDAQRNSGGSRFNGIGITFSNEVCYLYKAFVLPEFRGRNIAKELIDIAVTNFSDNGFKFIVTTTDWTNAAFLNVVKSAGFNAKGLAGEFVLMGKHRYVIPNTIALQDGSSSTVSFHRPTRR